MTPFTRSLDFSWKLTGGAAPWISWLKSWTFSTPARKTTPDWGYVDVPDIPEGQALDVFSGLPLIRRATALLEWIGDGRAVTATGALRLRDIEAAAACVGVAVRGGPKQAGSPTPDSVGSASDVPTVRSMYEVPLLAQMWAALETAELIKITSTKVVPFEGTEDFLAGGPSARLEELAFFVDQFLVAAVLDYDPAQPWERTLAGLQASILMAAATEDPPSLERVLAAADQAPAAEKAMAGLLTGMAVSRMEALAELGLLTINTHFRVPPALIRCVATVFDDDRLLAELGLAPAADGPDVVPDAPAPANDESASSHSADRNSRSCSSKSCSMDQSRPSGAGSSYLPACRCRSCTR